MPFHSIEPRRLYRQIADQIRTLIKSGEFPAGARLPPERDLAKQLGVSRPSVREALIALEVEGLVEVRIGSGIYVQPGNDDTGADQSHEAEAGPFELLRARYVIESECAALAAKSAKKSQIVAIADALDEMQREMEVVEHHPLNGDRLFHLRIAEATGNGALVAVVKMWWEERTGPLYKQLEDHYDSPALWEAAMTEHRAVLKAIAARDAEGARAAMQRHLNQAYKRFTIGWDNLQ
jgi:DNA-binding FadR family transcriptional regulator